MESDYSPVTGIRLWTIISLVLLPISLYLELIDLFHNRMEVFSEIFPGFQTLFYLTVIFKVTFFVLLCRNLYRLAGDEDPLIWIYSHFGLVLALSLFIIAFQAFWGIPQAWLTVVSLHTPIELLLRFGLIGLQCLSAYLAYSRAKELIYDNQ